MSESTINPESTFTTTRRDGTRVVSFCCDVALYTNADLVSIPASVLHVYDKFLATCPPQRLRWYASEHMTRHKPATPRAFDLLRGWLRNGAPARKMINIHMKDGEQFDQAPDYSFWVFGKGPGGIGYADSASSVRCTFPGSWGMANSQALLDFAADACAHFPFTSGHAGFVLETSPYYRDEGHIAAWRTSMQHPGLDISNPITDPNKVRNGIKGVNWLTMLGPEFIDRLGGLVAIRQALPASIAIIPAGAGIILRAGPVPRWGHVNRQDVLPEYRGIYKLVRPLQDSIVARYTSFSLPGGDHKGKTTAWLRRFSDGV